MAKGGRRNSQKKKKNSKANEDIDNENGDEDVKRCPHISKSVKLQNLQNKIPHTTLGQCLGCGELDLSEGLGVCICLCCAHQGCDRNSEEKHSLSHNKSSPSHNIVVHLQNWVVWCYACDDEVPVEPESTLHNCIKLILKAMKLSPPPELEVSLASPTKAPSSDKPKKGESLKNSSQLRSQIKGLANLGNTCFFNAVMQNLCQTELLHVAASCSAQEGFSQHVSPQNKDLPRLTVTVQEGPGSVTKALWKLLQEFRSSNSGTINPRQLFGEICKTATRFKGYRQQDSQELLRYLLDSIRNEEIRRVKLAVLKSFDVTGGDSAKNLDDNKKAQVKEYGASAEAPLIDSVFAGRLVSIVICRQCHKEFKVEETFLDLSLPLTAPQQESWNNKIFGKGVKQNPKSPKSASNKAESAVIKDNDTETGTDSKAKSPSKHQLKSARKADRKKGKKGKGRGKTGKGKSSVEPIDNKRADNNAEEEDEKGESEDEGHELDQMNVSDLQDSDNEQKHEVIDSNNAAEAVNASSECEEMLSNNTQAQHEKSSSQMSQGGDEDLNKLDSLGGVKRAGVGVSKPTGDNSQHAGGNVKTETEPAASELVQTENTDCLNKKTNRKDVESFERDEHECDPKTVDVQNEVTSMGISNSENRDIVLSQPSTEFSQINTEVIAEQDPSATIYVKELSPTNTSDSKIEEEDQDFDGESDMKQASDVSRSVSSSASELIDGIKDLNLNTGLIKDDGDFQKESVSSKESKDSTLQGRERESLEIKSEGLPPAGHLLGGNSQIVATSVVEDTSSSSRQINSSSNEAEGNAIETKTNEGVAGPQPNNQDCTEEIGIGANKNTSSTSVEGKEIGAEAASISENISDECDSDSEDEYEPDSGAERTLTLQPAYQPSQGECSVMSCLSQFCAPELLDGNNKFACEECSKRAHRLKKEKESNIAGKEKSDDDKDDVSDDDECKGAKAAKKKETKQETVYTVATKQLLISLAPPVLTLHLKRFQQARFTLRKLTKMVDFPLELNLAPFCSRSGRSCADSEGQVLYSLYGIVQHSGNMNSGHYTAYVKVSQPPVKGLYDRVTNMNELTDFVRNMWDGKTQAKHHSSRFRHEPATDGQWFHVSDSSVSAIPETKVLKSQAYMLFYGRLPLGSR